MQSQILAITEGFDGKLERILSELEKTTKLVKQPSKKHLSDQLAFIEALIEWAAVKSISLHSINHPLLREMIHCANSGSSVPLYKTARPHIKRLADVDR
jgi:hypothetical protein